MAVIGRLIGGLRGLLRRTRAEQDLDDELRGYLETAVEQKMAAGLSLADASRAARVEMGGLEATKDRVRDVGWETVVDSLWHDVRYAIRGLRASPAFTAVAVLTLALGIGANTAIFSVVHAVLLQPLPFAHSDRVIRIFENIPPRQGSSDAPRRASPLDASDLATFRSQATTLSHVGVQFPTIMTLSGREGPIRLGGVRLSPALLTMVDAQPIVGRAFDARDEVPGADGSIILSSTVWERHFGGNPDIVGRSVTLDGRGYAVVGVMPGAFQFPEGHPEFWIPFVPPASGPNMRQRLPILARLKDDVSVPAATAEVSMVLTQLRGDRRPDAGAVTASRFILIGVQDLLVAAVKPALLVLAAAVGFVLLIACVNVTNILLARTASRQREIAIRLALGAGRGRLARQALTESAVLALAGGAAGTALAFGAIRLLQVLGTSLPRTDIGPGVGLPRLDEVGIDASVLAFTVAVSMLTGVLFGLAPAMRQSRPDSGSLLREGAGSEISGFTLFRRHRTQGLLVIAEIGMAMMLLVGGGLLIHSFINLSNANPGYDPSDVLTFQVSLPPGRSDGQLKTFAEDLAGRFRALPRVRGVGYAESLPLVRIGRLAWLGTSPDMPIPRNPAADGLAGTPRQVSARIVSRDFLPAMGTRVIEGRGFDENDRAGEPQVMLINRTLARSGFLGDRPLGNRIYAFGNLTFDPRRLGPSERAPQPWEIVGIVADIRQSGLDQEPGPEMFVDFRQLPGPSGPPGSPRYFAMRVEGDATPVASSIRTLAGQSDPQAMVENIAPMERLVSNSIARPRLYAVLLGIFAGVAVALAAIGIYGVMACSVSRRTREIGIRMALGARRSEILGLVLGQSLVLAWIGIALGLGGAAAVTRYLEQLLFGITPLDATTFIVVALAFGAVAMIAAFVPARRATTVDPLVALRCE